MKIFSIISVILTIFFTAVLFEGIMTSSSTSVSASITIEAPQPVIYNTLKDVLNYEQWNTLSSGKNFSEKDLTRSAVYNIGTQHISINEKLTILPKENSFLFAQVDSLPGSFLTDLNNAVSYKGLADGTTEISWQTSYSISNITANLINRIYIKPALKQALADNLKSLKEHIEN